MVQHREYSQYFISKYGIQPLEIMNHHVVQLKLIYNVVYKLSQF